MTIFHRRCEGQIAVELIMILPVLILMIFFVLEYGNIAYHTILANHASYEFARVGALSASVKPSEKADKSRAVKAINAAKQRVFGENAWRIVVQVEIKSTGRERMYHKHAHEDIIVTITYPVRLAFPGTSWLLASDPKKDGIRKVKVTTRMPVEKTYASSDEK